MQRITTRFAVLPILGWVGLLAMAASAHGQARPYIGYVYPAGGQQGTTLSAKLGGQNLDGTHRVLVSGTGVSAKVVEYYRKLGNQEMTLMNEQLRELKRGARGGAKPRAGKPPAEDEDTLKLITRIEKRVAEYVNRPASTSISSLAFIEVTVAPDAEPGQRELRLATARGVSNPLVFHIGQVPEVARKPMHTSTLQVLGKEEQALRKRPPEEEEVQITVPCTVNGQIASGEVNRYRFEARKGQRLLISTAARQLIPFIADAVPGWFQPVLTVHDAAGNELAYNDDFRFKPDPIVLFEVPADGEYQFTIADAIFRGREDFVYRVTIGELPFVTSIFPLGGQLGAPFSVEMKGWNLDSAELLLPARDAAAGIQNLAARREGFVSNSVPFALDELPESFEQEPNNVAARAQKIQPGIINGRIDRPQDSDVFRFEGRGGETIVAEVCARRLDSPLDSVLQLTDAAGRVLAFNDDHEDAAYGANTHHADSYLMVELPADGTYFVHLNDAARNGGEEFGYRLRIGPPRPDFALRVVPSGVALRPNGTATVSVYALRKDGFAGEIALSLKDPPAALSAAPIKLKGKQDVAKFTIRAGRTRTGQVLDLAIEGTAKIQDREVAHEAVAAEDRMQAFLWRHLVPARSFTAVVYNPGAQNASKRVLDPKAIPAPAVAAKRAPEGVKFTKQQVGGRLRQLKWLFEEWLITDEFYARKVAECEGAL